MQNVIINRRTSEEWGKDRLVETLVDGHLRVSLAISHGNDTVPVTYVDLTPNEEKLILATIDPISAMAVTDKEQLDALLREIDTGEAAVQKMLSELAATNGLITPDNPYEEYLGMPDYEQETIRTFHSIKVHFETESDMIAFARLISQTVTDKTTYIYYPKQEKIDGLNYRVIDES